MNKMHSLAKIVLAGLALYIIFCFGFQLLSGLAIMFLRPYNEMPILNIILLLFVCLCLTATIYLFIYKSDKLAEKIVGTFELPTPEAQIQWLPVAFRLVAVSAGVICLYRFIAWGITIARSYAMAKASNFEHAARFLRFEQIAGWLILLVIAIYLLYGAPHFVRWHVKKTLEQCKQSPEPQKNTGS